MPPKNVFFCRPILLAATFAAALLAGAAASRAEQIFGLTVPSAGLQQIVTFDSENPTALLTAANLSGTTGSEFLADFDIFPVTGGLVGIGITTGTLYNINPLTGVATVNVVPSSSVGVPQDIDFNPSADRLRISSASNGNYRVTPTGFNNSGLTAGQVTADGVYTFAIGDPNAAATPNIVGNAYTNSFDGAATTSLYSLDTGVNALVLHTGGPAFSTLTTVAGLTVGGNAFDIGSLVGFDISGASGVAYFSNGNSLYTLNLSNAQATLKGTVTPGVTLQSIAAVPEPGSVSLVVAGMALAAGWRRRR